MSTTLRQQIYKRIRQKVNSLFTVLGVAKFNATSSSTQLGIMHTVLGVGFSVILFALMGLTVADVAGRYLFNAPLTGATELTEILLVSVIFMGLPVVCLDNSHITVDLVVDRFPAFIQPLRQWLLALITTLVLSVISWRLWVYADQIASYNGTTNSLRLPLAPVAYLCSMTTALAAIITLYFVFKPIFYAIFSSSTLPK